MKSEESENVLSGAAGAQPGTVLSDDPAKWWRKSRFPLFIGSRALSLTGDMAATSALSIHVYQSTSSGLAVSGVFVARVLPRIFGALAGAIGDKVDLRQLLIWCDLVAGLVFVVIGLSAPGYLVLLGMLLVAESVATVASPASETMVARTIPDHALARANGLVMAVEAIGFAAGSALGSLAAISWGYQYALYVNASSFVLSALLISVIPKVPPVVREDAEGSGFLSETLAGLRELRGDRQVMVVAVAMIGVTFGAALDRPALVVLTQHNLGGSGVGYGLALGGVSFGVLAATVLMGRWRLLTPSATVLLIGVALEALGHLAMGLSPMVSWLVVAAFVGGFGNGVEAISGTTLLQRSSASGSIGLLMGVVMSGCYLADAIGSIVGGAIVGVTGARWSFVIAAALMAGCAIVVGLSSRQPTSERSGNSVESSI
ncbi:MFS transporter [Streptomyces sp. WI04-05B]|uniref:MFS transporter n=1 Tax=Streptomyces TaxID=1883 RepID=UPI0029ADF20F|nr:MULTISPECIES: MFS transporter [unclassified Streptomyces]MDX2547621.1 MFS transporter [Streptomyces sp. WI04-05B]MDX2590123.1 MFS transporter [Streptomyces sp. WI04-05A]